ncbi:hypothetical protein [Rheinheimera sp.]|uniref:hypothetical protein n=1 Tax=Rheinheimera sp. TaxID=1869214 RepID=UPI003AF70A0B
MNWLIAVMVAVFVVAYWNTDKYDSRKDLTELSHYYQQHQAEFRQLAQAACAYRARNPGTYLTFEVDFPASYPAEIQPEVDTLKRVLRKMGKTELALPVAPQGGCSLFLLQWFEWRGAGGSHLGFSYQPAQHTEYKPELHDATELDLTQPLFYSKTLGNGWVLEYVNIP